MRESSGPLDVVLVVKGAGVQAPGDTLDLFTNGFWPAVLSLDADAHIRMRADAGSKPPRDETGPDDAPQLAAEIESRGRRVWIREVDWESNLRPDSPMRAASREWRMASWVLLFELYQWIASLGGFLRQLAEGLRGRSAADGAGPAEGRSARRSPRTLHLFAAFCLAYLILFTAAEMVLLSNSRSSTLELLRGADLPAVLLSMLGLLARAGTPEAGQVPWGAAGFVVLLSALSALPAAWRARSWHADQEQKRAAEPRNPPAEAASPNLETKQRGRLSRAVRMLAGSHDDRRLRDGRPVSLSNLLLLLLLASLIFGPANYLGMLALLLIWQAIGLLARAAFWSRRPVDESDIETRFRGDLASLRQEAAGTLEPLGIQRRPPLRAPLFLYRTIVVLAMPLFFMLWVLARLMEWTRVLAPLGKLLESGLQTWLGGIMGDVVSYAMDPAKAARIRSAVEREIQHYTAREDVDAIHVVAHSQGTPITFELLYRHLPPASRRKIKSYLTLGSVLSYYHHADAVLDPFYYDQRFPPPRYPAADEFAPGYRWFNCWNLTDPITEFYGIDEYQLVRGAQTDSPLELPPLTAADLECLHPLSPRNIKTPASLKHHSDYWTNQDWVQRPFAKRVLGLAEAEWPPDPRDWRPGKPKRHALPIFGVHTAGMLLTGFVAFHLVARFNVLVTRGLALLVDPPGGLPESEGLIGTSISMLRGLVTLLIDPTWLGIRAQLVLATMLLVPVATWGTYGWYRARKLLSTAT